MKILSGKKSSQRNLLTIRGDNRRTRNLSEKGIESTVNYRVKETKDNSKRITPKALRKEGKLSMQMAAGTTRPRSPGEVVKGMNGICRRSGFEEGSGCAEKQNDSKVISTQSQWGGRAKKSSLSRVPGSF